MESNSLSNQKAQLDKAEREHLEDVVEKLRSRVEDNVRFQLTQKGLDDEPEDKDSLDGDIKQLVDAIDLEGVDGHTWEEAFEKYIAGVGYTIVNRLAALRCMEVRDFIKREVTRFKDSGLTPAAEPLTDGTEDFLLEDEAILAAYHNTCDELADEIEILFDRSSTYSLIDPDDDTFEEICGMLDDIPDEVWRADDVLGWIYEYYNRPVVEALDAKNKLDPEDIGPANQFYTPHWVVRMLADNSLGRLYLEATDQEDEIPKPGALSPEERKNRQVTPTDAPTVPELCTYLIPDEEHGNTPEFDHPQELRVIDPACGSGHFLLYAFDILERIWWAETNLDRAEIPAKILEHNLYGVDIDLRSCQLTAFNLYLKARTRAEEEEGEFEMPNVGIVCADARVAEIEDGTEVIDEITGEGTDLRKAIDDVIETFQHTEALGSLLDVSGTLEEAFDSSKTQAELSDYNGGAHQSLHSFLKALRRAVEDQTSDSFREQNLRSFLNLLVVLTQEYDIALMNPPYGSRGRMPNDVKKYVSENYQYTTEYYINFVEASERLVSSGGRLGMLIKREFMFKRTFEDFRKDFIGELGSFDFVTEFGQGLLDKATVRNAGAIVRVGQRKKSDSEGLFFRLHDVDKGKKEYEFLKSAYGNGGDRRRYSVSLSEFSMIPGAPLSYWVPKHIRSLYDSPIVLDSGNANINKESLGITRAGVQTGKDARFLRRVWETNKGSWVPFAKGGQDAWMLPKINLMIQWKNNGEAISRKYEDGNGTPNRQHYFKKSITYTVAKESGRRFGYLDESIFSHKGSVVIPKRNIWSVLGYLNSELLTYLVLAQTPSRFWEVGELAKLPWYEELLELGIGQISQEIAGSIISLRRHEFDSPHYTVPVLLYVLGYDSHLSIYNDHPHRDLLNDLETVEPSISKPDESIQDLGIAASEYKRSTVERAENKSENIDKLLFSHFDISDDTIEEIYDEISVRTNQDPRLRQSSSVDTANKIPKNLPEMVKDLLLHLTLKIVHESDDGIISISDVDGEDDLLTHVEEEFEHIWGEYATDRLAEVDNVLGTKSAAEEAYPNLRTWLKRDLFDYHVSKFERTPVLWRFTTERLVSDSEGEGFGCLVDYHQLDEGIFDRLQNNYLEPRKNLLRERRSAANRRRSNDSLSASEQAEAAEEYARCESGLEQIAVFEDRLAELAQSNPRQWSTEKQQAADSATERVAEFRRRTEERLKIVDELAAMEDVDMGELFTGNFYQKVEDQREEWIDGLDDLEAALNAYAVDSDQPVEAHLYDLFDYYTDDLLGSSHFASNGIFYMTYYFDNFEQADQARLDDADISRRQRLISQLASDLEEYIELGESISEDCQEISSDISSDWADRALSEITTAGYQPNHKHGVEINIIPLSDAEIVPKTVDDEVL
ncbi:BREX-5 system adenine-specific DNA-methyltransferase PglX [Halovenus rubra]|uniref:site-specific DNA-methyltransferase (adenine-specific) n=2 Tax=Halovenus rubra TaxID=869890 RepID=A0ABD5X2Z2_9EURY|nr:BREX-5 system adenine-specific DNA-methyltransferase PglX [Halovenus rubra]